MTITEHITALARAYADHKGIALSTVGLRATNHGGFFARLQNGRSLTDSRYQRLIHWFRLNWPAELPWVFFSDDEEADNAARRAPASDRVCDEGHMPK